MPSRRTLLTAALAGAASPLALTSPAHAQTYAAYAMGYFKESPDETDDSHALHLAVSDDATGRADATFRIGA